MEIMGKDHQKIKHLLYCPVTGLGNFQGFRGNRWLKSRIQIFKQFVISSLQAQTNQDFILWFSWRPEEKNNPIVKEFTKYLRSFSNDLKNYPIHTFSGVCFWDDKYENEVARERLASALHGSMGELINAIGDCDYVLMTVQPSDDLYHRKAVESIQEAFIKFPQFQAIGYVRGYIMNYLTKEVKSYNPTTNPPFYTIKFPRSDFIDPLKHMKYTSLKRDVDKYKQGITLPSHEYIADCLNYGKIEDRGFLVGTHFDNISTGFNNPYAGEKMDNLVLKDFGIFDVGPLKVRFSLKRILFHKLPHRVKRKLRFWAGEKKWVLRPFFSIVYNFLRE